MIKLHIVTHGDKVGPVIDDEAQFDAAIAAEAARARKAKRPQLIELRPVKGYGLSLAVGDDETYLVFGGKGRRPIYCHSLGVSKSREHDFMSYQGPHEVTMPRRMIIPLADGMRAVKEFIAEGKRPTGITWEEMVP